MESKDEEYNDIIKIISKKEKEIKDLRNKQYRILENLFKYQFMTIVDNNFIIPIPNNTYRIGNKDIEFEVDIDLTEIEREDYNKFFEYRNKKTNNYSNWYQNWVDNVLDISKCVYIPAMDIKMASLHFKVGNNKIEVMIDFNKSACNCKSSNGSNYCYIELDFIKHVRQMTPDNSQKSSGSSSGSFEEY